MCWVIEQSLFNSMNTSAQAVNFNMDKFQASHFMDAAEDSVSILDPSFHSSQIYFFNVDWLFNRKPNSMALIKASQFCSKFAESNRATVKQVTKKVHCENYTKYVWKWTHHFPCKFFYFLFLKWELFF